MILWRALKRRLGWGDKLDFAYAQPNLRGYFFTEVARVVYILGVLGRRSSVSFAAVAAGAGEDFGHSPFQQ